MDLSKKLLRQGIQAAKAGQAAEAFGLLKQVVEREPHNEKAWLWLSAVVETDEQRLVCLQNVLTINPHNQAAQRGLAALRHKGTAQVITESPAPTAPLMVRPQAKKSSPWVTIGLVTIGLLLIGLWCSNRWDAFFGTGFPTSATPDPLAECRLLLPSYLEEDTPLVGRFEDDATLASNTARIALAPIVQRLQDTYREHKALRPPDCAAQLYRRTCEWMDWTILGFHAFMAEDQAPADIYFQDALKAKRDMLTELDRLPGPK